MRRTGRITVVAATALALVTAAGAQLTDTTPPRIAVTLAGKQGADGWYVGDVAITWTVRDAESGIAASTGCKKGKLTADTRGKTLRCTARNGAGLRASKTVTIKLDKTPPSVSAGADRPPDVNGWYNHPLTIAFSATDATSGVAGCDGQSTYTGPDGTGLSVGGGCSDRAGQRSTAAYAFQYDATPTGPVKGLVSVAGDHRATLRWSRPAEPDLDHYVVTRTGPRKAGIVVYEGRNAAFVDRGVANGVKVQYEVAAIDHAGNRSPVVTASATPALQLLTTPAANAHVRGRPLLRWVPYRSPRYYNVQLWRGGGKILSVWPSHARYRLPRQWTFNGRSYRLEPGRYRWFVWPAYGPRSAARYGKALGTSVFFVVK